jgi:heme/copper-type cytochrome/quinol oxidase subunit 2
MIEWQSESSLFTLRVRGKQWYWVYKFELKSLADLNGAAINIGDNFWRNNATPNKHHQLALIQEKHNLTTAHLTWTSSGAKQFVQNNEFFTSTLSTNELNSVVLPTVTTPTTPSSLSQPTNNHLLKHNFMWRSSESNLKTTNYATVSLLTSNLTQRVDVSNTSPNITRIDKVKTNLYNPVRVLSNSTNDGLKLSYQNTSIFSQKPTSSNFYLVIKQKRYEPTSMTSNKNILNNLMKLTPSNFNAGNTLLYTQNNSNHSEISSLQSNRRLLRTRRVLVIPAHTNITLITNSFDVMHSWYIPGLGVKMDCVPGRSTHHTLHIDHAGFYYGQCAEICGRYHHHMPIRVCALPFEHFLIWWYHYGAPFFLAGNQDRSSFKSNSFKQLNW